jgi:hypothetical protein
MSTSGMAEPTLEGMVTIFVYSNFDKREEKTTLKLPLKKQSRSMLHMLPAKRVITLKMPPA